MTASCPSGLPRSDYSRLSWSDRARELEKGLKGVRFRGAPPPDPPEGLRWARGGFSGSPTALSYASLEPPGPVISGRGVVGPPDPSDHLLSAPSVDREERLELPAAIRPGLAAGGRVEPAPLSSGRSLCGSGGISRQDLDSVLQRAEIGNGVQLDLWGP